ncbi:hypothetical protein CWB99_06500 [Pseudoalteromonas rubra]|uniref:Uncharacterized protein n=1 Tax=Pseudoalteromonas rubra TaxID=43658 RepID=A0A5S3WPD0_9GAMM|nr:hypothetical protein [Pseudoalteromonas rubra]TMP30387.1 hypothetical protein CWB99_06500 [Pseudoalteromonas rubra]TMP35410.1 hypothetical protein CWC00_04560 [Pseudoalteromonas rubra]
MASIQTAVQVMVDKLVADMQGEQPLSAEEQALVSNAITKLADNEKLEQAVVAVAESHIDNATTALQQAAQVGQTSLQQAAQTLNDNGTTLEGKAAKLDRLDTMAPSLARVEALQGRAFTNQIRPVFALTPIEAAAASGNNARSSAVFAVYDHSGETYLVRPSTTYNSSTENCRLEYLRIPDDGSGKTTIHSSFTYSNAFAQNPTSQIYLHGASAFIPLGSKGNPEDIDYDVVYSTQEAQATGNASYGGVYVRSQGYTSLTKPKQNLNARDRYGVTTRSSYGSDDVAVLYDNQKHCLVMVDEGTSLVIEKYRDGNVITSIAIANQAEWQAYVDAGDFTTVCFIYHSVAQPYGMRRYTAGEHRLNHYAASYYGYFGVLNGNVKMGGSKYSAHYRFTSELRLEPINFFFTSNSEPYRAPSSNGTTNGEGEVTVALESMSGELLGMYSYRSRAETQGYDAGYVAGAINCINPYSHIGLLNEYYMHNSHGLGRTCRAF